MTELNYWCGKLKSGRISRREFVGRAAALGLTSVAVSSLLSSPAMAQEPKKGGYAKFGLKSGSTTDTYNPGTWADNFSELGFYGSMCNCLTEVDINGNIIGDLAESFEPSQGGKIWTFQLLKGVTFHNGRELAATDVVESYRFHMDEKSTSSAKSLLENVVNLQANGKHEIVFTLASGNADFPFVCSDRHLVIMPAESTGGIDWSKGIGTGPFSVENFEPGISLKMNKHVNYHKPNKPYFDQVELLTILDSTARTSALISGSVHYMDACELKTLDLLRNDPNLEILEVKGLGYLTYAMDTSITPFNNPDFRLAMKYAVDRKEFIEKILLGHGTAGNDVPVSSIVKYAIQPEPIYNYDIDKAKFHLKKSGLQDSRVPLSLADAAFAGAVDGGLLYAESAKKVGINIDVIREPNDGYWDNVWKNKPMCGVYWSGRPTCDWVFTQCYSADAPWNDSKWKNERFNELLPLARSELDDAKRAALYAEMQQIVHDDSGTIVLAFNNYVTALSNKIGHGPVAGNNDVDGTKATERWWFV